MRWPEKPPEIEGRTRIKTKFLLWPRCLNGEWRWLEFAKIEQKRRKIYIIGGEGFIWDDVAWTN